MSVRVILAVWGGPRGTARVLEPIEMACEVIRATLRNAFEKRAHLGLCEDGEERPDVPGQRGQRCEVNRAII